MATIPAWLFGLELTRFAPADDSADALGSSLTAIEGGGWTLSTYEGPALQPYAGLSLGRVDLELAPAAAFRRERAESAEGGDGTLRSWSLRLGARVEAHLGPALIGVEGAYSDGAATLDREPLASAVQAVEIGPTLGLVAPLSARWHLLARARWPVEVVGRDVTQGLSGALALEWRGGRSG